MRYRVLGRVQMTVSHFWPRNDAALIFLPYVAPKAVLCPAIVNPLSVNHIAHFLPDFHATRTVQKQTALS